LHISLQGCRLMTTWVALLHPPCQTRDLPWRLRKFGKRVYSNRLFRLWFIISPAVIQVDDTVDNTVIVNTFANYFASNCSSLNDCRNEAITLQYQELREQYTGFPIVPGNLFGVQLINTLINKMDKGKAAGIDDITSEHLMFSHPMFFVY